MLSCVQLFEIPRSIARQPPLSMEFSRQEYWGGLLFPSPEDLSDPGFERASPVSPALAGRFFTAEPPGKLVFYISASYIFIHSVFTAILQGIYYHIHISIILILQRKKLKQRG